MSQEVLLVIQQVKLFLLSQKKMKLLSSVKAQWVLGPGDGVGWRGSRKQACLLTGQNIPAVRLEWLLKNTVKASTHGNFQSNNKN